MSNERKYNKYVKVSNKLYLDLLLRKNDVFFQLVNGIYYISDKHIVTVLQYKDLYINNERCKSARVKDILDSYRNKEYNVAYVGGTDDKKYIKLTDNIKNVLIDIKYYKIFENFNFYISNIHSAVLVYDNTQLIGLIMPIKEY